LTHALRHPETAVAAAAALAGSVEKAAVEGLVELLYEPPSAAAAAAALAALEGRSEAIVLDALAAAVENPQPSVRLAAVEALGRRGAAQPEDLERRLLEDPSWMVRRAALRALAQRGDMERILAAATDPHWRVRHALIQILLPLVATGGPPVDLRGPPRQAGRPSLREETPRVRGVQEYLRYCGSGIVPSESALAEGGEDPAQLCPFWDWDAAVLVRKLERMGEAGRRQALGVMPFLLGHADERVRAVALEVLRDWGDPEVLARVVQLLDEPRAEGAAAAAELLAALDLDRVEDTARLLLEMEDATPAQRAWALDQVGVAIPFDEAPPALDELLKGVSMEAVASGAASARRLGPHRRADAAPLAALVRLAGRPQAPPLGDMLRQLLADSDPAVQLACLGALAARPELSPPLDTQIALLHAPAPAVRAAAVACFAAGAPGEALESPAHDADVRVRLRLAEVLTRHPEKAAALLTRLQADPHPHVRAAALTATAAEELVRNPARETSWHVRARAARLAKVPLWKLEPEHPWKQEKAPPTAPAPLSLSRTEPPHARLLGPQRLPVAPLGVSGHYGLPVEGFVRAAAAGVNLFFWEPNYLTLTEFAGRLSPADRRGLHFLAGTFEADGRRVRRDAERALRMLRLDRLALYLLFWVQSWDRVSPDVREALERLRAEGKVACYGLSTHSRRLAVEAVEAGWDPVMVRHSAAHRGAERDVFPVAAARGRGLLTFSATCYGRLLKPRGGLEAPTGADCYRYALAQPGVAACLTAPATLELLEENLAALRLPHLDDERRQRLLAQGASLYEDETIFRRLVRSR
jgi:HEAT repeat protein